MHNLIVSILAFVVTLGILVTIHEFGHYWVARKMGVKVLRFSVGFGKIVWSRRSGPDNTEYALAALPLGGYVKMLDEREGEVDAADLPRAFNRQSIPRRFAIVFAGPLFNFLFAIFAYWLLFVTGVDGVKPLIGEVAPQSAAYGAGLRPGDEIVAVDGEETKTWEAAVFKLVGKTLDKGDVQVTTLDGDHTRHQHTLNLDNAGAGMEKGSVLDSLGLSPVRPVLEPVIGELESGSAGAKAGLQVGDRILSIDGQTVQNWDAWATYVRARPGKAVSISIERNGGRQLINVTPASIPTDKEGVIGRIGAAPVIPTEIPEALRAETKYGPLQAVGMAAQKTWQISALTLQMLYKMLIGQASTQNLSGPISIAQYAGYTASDGLTAFLGFLAIVSISLGVLNLLPVPLLDGGHLMYYLVEAIKGSPVSQKVQVVGQQLGIALLLCLTVLAFYNDLTRLFGPHS